MYIMGASSIDDHISKLVVGECYLSKETPPPTEVTTSLMIISESNPKALRAWRRLQVE